MNTSKQSQNTVTITVADISVDVVRKDIKNLHLSVHPPEGYVRLSVPQHVTDDNARLAIVARLAWIKQQRESFAQQPRQSERLYITGESHFFRGKRYLLEIVEQHGSHRLELQNNAVMRMTVNPGTSQKNRQLVLDNWYRTQLKHAIENLLVKWLPVVDKPLSAWGIKRMKTKWGSCNANTQRIWLNLELAKKSPECLEYILIHELVHLHERKHNERFLHLMDHFLPHWRKSRDVLKSEPLAHEAWRY